MKKNLNLFALADNNIKEKEMKSITGGEPTCGCGCCYSNNGGSSTGDNMAANYEGHLHSVGCDNNWVYL